MPMTHIEKIEAYEQLIEDLLDLIYNLDQYETFTEKYCDRFEQLKEE